MNWHANSHEDCISIPIHREFLKRFIITGIVSRDSNRDGEGLGAEKWSWRPEKHVQLLFPSEL